MITRPTPEVDIGIEQGATWSQTFTWLRNTEPVDLSGCTARAQARLSVENPEKAIELTTENGGIVLGGTAGTVTFQLSDAQTSAIPTAKYVYDLEIVRVDGTVEKMQRGKIVVWAEVTR